MFLAIPKAQCLQSPLPDGTGHAAHCRDSQPARVNLHTSPQKEWISPKTNNQKKRKDTQQNKIPPKKQLEKKNPIQTKLTKDEKKKFLYSIYNKNM